MKTIEYIDSLASCIVYPDSALGRDAMPLFLPPGLWSAQLAIAYRIGRLGKNVKAKFAPRYVDGISSAIILKAANPLEAPAVNIMDNAVVPGRFLSPDWELPFTLSFEYSDGAEICQASFSTEDLKSQIAQAVEEVTQIATVKTGDIFLLRHQLPLIALQPDTKILSHVNGHCVLALKIK